MAAISQNERLARLGLALTEGVGPVRVRRLIDHFGSAEAALAAPIDRLAEAARLKPERAAGLAGAIDRAEAELAGLARLGGWAVVWGEDDYPEALTNLYDPPLALFGLGRFSPADGRAVAVVGSRNATDYGLRTTRRLAAELAALSVTVVSGLAVGIDSAAHDGALSAGGRSIGVLGCGLDVDYPRENRELKRRLAENGAVITEFPLGSEPAAWRFPVRNRIIAGLSRGVIVAEASPRSGSIITANLAAENGRTVMAVPGPITDRRRQGTHRLIREGAVLITSGAEAAVELWPEIDLKPSLLDAESRPSENLELDAGAERIYRLVEHSPRHADEIIRETGLSAPEAQGLLLDLELKGLIKRLPGQMFVRK